MWQSSAKRCQHPNPPQTFHLFPFINPAKSTARTITLLLGTCKHWALLASNIYPNPLHQRYRAKHLRRLDSRPDTPHSLFDDPTISFNQRHRSRKLQIPNCSLPSTSLPHWHCDVSILVHRHCRLPPLLPKYLLAINTHPSNPSRTSLDSHPRPPIPR